MDPATYAACEQANADAALGYALGYFAGCVLFFVATLLAYWRLTYTPPALPEVPKRRYPPGYVPSAREWYRDQFPPTDH